MSVALRGDPPPLLLAGRTVLRAGQTAIADRLRDRRQPVYFAYFQSPAQGQNLAHTGDALQAHYPLVEFRMFFELLQQPPLDRSEELHLSPAQLQQLHY